MLYQCVGMSDSSRNTFVFVSLTTPNCRPPPRRRGVRLPVGTPLRRRLDKPRGPLTAEMWFAPSLQYLPVRIRITQSEDTYLDLLVETIEQR